MKDISLTNKPLAAHGLLSYRCRSAYGWIMIGATDHADALLQANRSRQGATMEDLQAWNGKAYVPVVELGNTNGQHPGKLDATIQPTPEEVIEALATLGEDPDATRVEALSLQLAGRDLPSGERAEAIQQVVSAARNHIDACGAAFIKVLSPTEYRESNPVPAWDAFYTVLPGVYPVRLVERLKGYPFAVADADVVVIHDAKATLFGGVAVHPGDTSNHGKQIRFEVPLRELLYDKTVEIHGVTWSPVPNDSNYLKPSLADGGEARAQLEAADAVRPTEVSGQFSVWCDEGCSHKTDSLLQAVQSCNGFLDEGRESHVVDANDLHVYSVDVRKQLQALQLERRSAFAWSRYPFAGVEGYEISSAGDKRFSALNARLADGRTIEEAYQLDVKGYRVQGNHWRLGKGKSPLQPMTQDEIWKAYAGLWRQWADENPTLMAELRQAVAGKVLTDKFAATPVSQARALAEILTEQDQVSPEKRPAPEKLPSSRELSDRYHARGGMPAPVVQFFYALRDNEVNHLAGQDTIEAADLQTLDRGARFKVAEALFARCSEEAQHALLNDAHHSVRSAAAIANRDQPALAVQAQQGLEF
ncbi:KH domain-containing protein [Ralstonia sp. ASV6]|uniref:KH domain-containing protein n=1 Tax=Ralstonia sp. ASV6 TaxID=2795124 RepID=UPI0018ECC074|nr:KH domain-containing protein [Ralstonia sp. ASV6]